MMLNRRESPAKIAATIGHLFSFLTLNSCNEAEGSGTPYSAFGFGQPKDPAFKMRVTPSETSTRLVSSAVAGWPVGLQENIRSTETSLIMPNTRYVNVVASVG